MTAVGLLVQVEAKPGKEDEVAKFLKTGQALVAQEPGTVAWFGIQMGPSTFGIFDAFDSAAGRDAHLSGPVAQALMASDLFAGPPSIVKVDVLADKLPG
jgi:quinol monooxygenase YgiN